MRRGIFVFASFVLASLGAVAAQERPNIIWVMAEDIGVDLACYGEPGVKTPVLDSMAATGLRYTRAYCSSPICSTNRTSMITGMYQNAVDGHNHRSHRKDGFTLPDPVKPITHYLREAGYYCALGCGYGAKTDFNFNTAEKPFDGSDWSKRAPGQPFFAQIQLKVTHRGDWWDKTRADSPSPIDPASVRIPPQFPDHPVLRDDWASYLDTVEKADREMGEILARLEREGIADNTVVFFIGDNGRCQIRGKGYLYEEGIKVPLIVHWPAKYRKGKARDELVTTFDISAQILELAGVAIPDYMQGRPFLKPGDKGREKVFAARDRWDEVMEKSRTVVTRRYKYIRNDMAAIPWDAGQVYVEENRPFLTTYRALKEQGKLTETQARYLASEKPVEELYDLQTDPWELNNLAGKAKHRRVQDSLAAALRKWEREINDRGRVPEEPEALDDLMRTRFWENPHMQRIIQTHPIRVSQSGQGDVKLSYAGMKPVDAKGARYGFEIWVDARPASGKGRPKVVAKGAECVWDEEIQAYRFMMPLSAVDLKVAF